MVGESTGFPGELRADPSMRWSVREQRSETGRALEGASHALAAALSLSYRRLNRFMEAGATAVRAGATSGRSALEDLRRHQSALRSAVRSGIREALLSEKGTTEAAFGHAAWASGPARAGFPLSAPGGAHAAALHGRLDAIASFARAKVDADGDEFDFFGRATAERVSRARQADQARHMRRAGFSALAAAERRVAEGAPADAAPIQSMSVASAERTASIPILAARLRRSSASASLGILMTLRAIADRAVSGASRVRHFLDEGSRRVFCGATVSAWKLQDSPSARFHAKAAAALGVAAAIVAVGYGNSHHIADGLQVAAQHTPNVSSAALAERGERASRILISTWDQFANSVGASLGGSAPGAGIVEVAHANADAPSLNAFATSALPLPPPAPPMPSAATELGPQAAGLVRRAARAASVASDLGATEVGNRRSLEVARRGAAMLSEADRLNAGELSRVRAGGADPSLVRPAHVSTGASTPLAGSKASTHGAWAGGGMLDRLRSLAGAAAEQMSFGGSNGTYDVRHPSSATGRVVMRSRPF